MASSSSKALMLSSSSSSHGAMYTGKWEYDVFLCFRGADTRDGFTSHLLEALSREKIKAFIDDLLHKTESIDELISVLRRSAVSIVIFSENFADSSWCLDEVATISQSMVEFGHRVLPVFYKVDPPDVIEDSGSYAGVIEQKHGASKSPKDRKRWMDALKVVANCAGHTSQAIKIDSELVKSVVKDVLKRLLDMSSRVKSDTLIGVDARISEVEQLLAMNVNDFRIIGLWGMGGVGKTTLAKACYKSFVSSGKEIKHHLVQDISEKLEKQSGIEGMVQELYSILLSEENLVYQNLDISYRRDRLSRLRVFLVLDNVETLSQLEQFFFLDVLNIATLFAPGSRIILTTRNRRVLDYVGACIYEVKCLHSHESLQLFGIHAFRQPVLPDDWSELADDAVSYCKGSPLAIKVMGGALFRRDKSYWKSFLCGLGKIPKPEIHDVLRRSYDMLGIVEKRMFLDIACFFRGLLKSVVISYCSTGHQPANYVIEDLISKSLFICVGGDRYTEIVEVHDLLREMAWNIVYEESKHEKRSRLKNSDDIHKIFALGKVKESRGFNCLNIMKAKEEHRSAFKGGSAPEGIVLGLSKVREMHLEANAFEEMTSLRYLDFFYPENEYGASRIRVPYGGLFTLPDSLRWLRWDGFPSKSLPSRFSPENLTVLILRGSSKMKRCWKVQPKLVNLVILHLSHCINLVAIPGLSGSPNLEFLILEGCKSLTELPSHVQDLDNLIQLDLNGCTNLLSLPPTLNSKLLKYVRLSNCPKLTACPAINSRELETLDMEETPIIALPRAIYNIKRGGTLRLCGKHMACFPAISASLDLFRLCHATIQEMDCFDDLNPGSLPRFIRLELTGNPQLKSLSRNIWKMVSQTLILQKCPSIESLPEISEPVYGLTNLWIFRCRNLKSFPSGIANLKSLQDLCISVTDIESIPPCIQELEQLSRLNLACNKSLEFVPSSIHKLSKLSHLSLMGCSRIKSLPELPPNLLTLDISGCRLLQVLPSNIARLRLERLYFDDCPRLDSNMVKKLVLNFSNHAASILHPQCFFQYSGNEIPEWFTYANHKNDSRMVVQLPPPNLITKQPIKGFAFGVLYSSDFNQFISTQMRCECNIDYDIVAAWSSPVFGYRWTQTDKVCMWYQKNLLGETKEVIQEEGKEPWYVRYAGRSVSFRIFPKLYNEDPKRLKSIKIKSIGFSMLY